MYNKKGRRSLCEVFDSMYLSSFYLCIHDLRALHSSVFENSHLLKKFRGFFLFNASVANMKSDFLVHKVRADICQACKFSSFSVRIQKKKCWPPKCTCKFYQCNLFSYILGNLPKKLSIQSIRRPKWHFISSRCLSSAIPERQYQIFVNYHKPSIHCFITFEALITWPI